MQVNTTLSFTVSSTSLDLGTPTKSELSAGSTAGTQSTLVTVKSNVPWRVGLRATGDFTYVAKPGSNLTRLAPKPISDLKWGTTSAAAANTAMALSDVDVFSSNNAATNVSTKTIFYRTLWSYAGDPPGTYTATLNYTISAP